jgi:hypothetical protein
MKGRQHDDYSVYKDEHPKTHHRLKTIMILAIYYGIEDDFPDIKSVLPVCLACKEEEEEKNVMLNLYKRRKHTTKNIVNNE